MPESRSNVLLTIAVASTIVFSGLAGAHLAQSPTDTSSLQALDTANDVTTGTAHSSAALPNLLVIVGPEDETSYELVVDGDLQKSDEQGATVDPEDSVDGSRATGVVAGNGADAYRFSGDITDVSLDGDATLYLNGKRYEPYPDQLIIVGPEGSTEYGLTVDGKLRKSGDRGATIDDEDVVEGNHATGTVAGNGADAYRFTGNVTDLALDGEATVYLNGEEVDPADLPATTGPDYPPDTAASISQDCQRFWLETAKPFDTLEVGVAGNTTGDAPHEARTTDSYSFDYEGQTRYAASYVASPGEQIVYAHALRDGRIVQQYEFGVCRA